MLMEEHLFSAPSLDAATVMVQNRNRVEPRQSAFLLDLGILIQEGSFANSLSRSACVISRVNLDAPEVHASDAARKDPKSMCGAQV
jgi:hypothetical protein